MLGLLKEECFTEKWINAKSRELSGNPDLIEKTLHAFALLGYLVQLESNFLFKGGTSLLLHVPKIKRLSIDIDIVYGDDLDEFTKKLSTIPGNSPFTRFEEDERGDRGLPNRKHFKFFYPSNISRNEESILLDIVLENPAFMPYVEEKQIKGAFIDIKTDLTVKIPTVEGLLGDKLTAFAPHTIGVPFETTAGGSMKMQVVKQLFDVGELFNIASNFDEIKSSYAIFFEKENSYRDNIYSNAQALDDTIEISYLLCLAKFRGYQPKEDTNNIAEGLKSITSHLLEEQFRIDVEAKIAASKAFFLTSSIKVDKHISLAETRYISTKIPQIKNVLLPAPYNWANKLKAVLPEAFYYIWQGVKE
ncbi:MAG: nucleotidyl transferase AbiEii/AbiGii toxin family protein [Candidatus Marinimicrobia bacterium]|nr:nucleotidyl transferase AbiEii/AbiGii toxin family protein [Candidatus Neomarinimicrobiota bacterium]